MIAGRKGGGSKKGDDCCSALAFSSETNPGYSSHTRGRFAQPRVPGIAPGLTDVGLGMALA